MFEDVSNHEFQHLSEEIIHDHFHIVNKLFQLSGPVHYLTKDEELPDYLTDLHEVYYILQLRDQVLKMEHERTLYRILPLFNTEQVPLRPSISTLLLLSSDKLVWRGPRFEKLES